jgi:hypothetical protein
MEASYALHFAFGGRFGIPKVRRQKPAALAVINEN